MVSEDLTSSLLLRIELPQNLPGDIRYENSAAGSWQHDPGELDGRDQAHEVASLLRGDPQKAASALTEVGGNLAAFLLDERAQGVLRDHHRSWAAGDVRSRGRIELATTPQLDGWPWEVAFLPDLRHLGAARSLTFVRKHRDGNGAEAASLQELLVHLIGVQHEPDDDYPSLGTLEEVEALREVFASSSWRQRYRLELDYQGGWEDLHSTFSQRGAPAILHFAGHGMKDGAGLVFRDKNGKARKVPASAIVTSLTSGKVEQRARLVFLNACFGAASNAAAPQPFGPLAEQLVAGGIPAVVAVSTKIRHDSAVELASEFYGCLADGASVDVAIQEARFQLLTKDMGPEWAFTTLMLSANPGQLLVPSSGATSRLPADILLNFGHGKQLGRLRNLVDAGNSAVLVVHGANGAGHEHLLRQIIRVASQRGRVFDPIPALKLPQLHNREVARHLLLGALAEALGAGDAGTEQRVLERIGEAVEARSKEPNILVLGFTSPIDLVRDGDIDLLLTLVREVWGEVMGIARQRRTSRGLSQLPVFLVLPLRYPAAEQARGPAGLRQAAERRTRVQQVVERLGGPQPDGAPFLMRVLPPLTDFEADELEQFFEDTRLLSTEAGREWAEARVGVDDNETILQALQQLVFQGGPR